MFLRNGILAVAILGLCTTATGQQPRHTRQAYLELAKAAYPKSRDACRAEVERWVKECKPHPLWGYVPPSGPVWLAGLAASLYDLTGEDRYAVEAVEWLANQHRFKEYFPDSVLSKWPEYEHGLPTLTDFFHLSAFCRAYLRVKNSPAAGPEQRADIERSIVESADFVFTFPEWGPMNRAILRAEGLELAAQTLPAHPRAPVWRKMARVLASDSWGHWEEEDAQIYHPVWLYSLIQYADAIGAATLFDQPTTGYYFHYFLHLLAPSGMVPDFGDGRWNGSWPSYLACLERGASQYRRGDLKWGAQRIFEAMTELCASDIGARTALILTDAHRWADDSVQPVRPTALSEEVLEDVIGKKIVFRSGWERDSTYLMLNYRDEGDYALIPRNFLRCSIPVEEEKMHHGHSDENAICLLMDKGSVLLHEGGYRPVMPSGPYGAYRADYFHNRLVGRKAKRGRQQPLFEFLRHSGAYHPVTTQKIDFFTLDEVDMSRTRMRDGQTGFESDRVIVWLKRDNIFIVFDIVKILEPDYYTFATLWHGTTMLDQGLHYYVTAVDKIGNYRPSHSRALAVHFLQHGIRQGGTFPIERHRQSETAVYQAISSHYYTGQLETFVTVLVPHPRGEKVEPILNAIELLDVDKPRGGVGVRLQTGGDVQYVCVKTDLMMDVLSENVRPRYTFESGRVKYGPIETDASFLYARQYGRKLSYSAANMVKILYNDQMIFSARRTTFGLQPDDLSTRCGVPKWRFWEDTVELE